MATISFDLVSPESLIFNDEVGMIIVPGKDGDLGVLPGHSKVMSSLRPACWVSPNRTCKVLP